MVAKEPIIDLTQIDLNVVHSDIDEIRRYNPQRGQMEHLSAIVYIDEGQHICVGRKNVTDSEFWVDGHMPGMPLMPGVIMCEAAAQLASFYTQRFDLLGSEMVGFGGLEGVRFRDPVVPGDTLYIVTLLTKVRRGRMIVCRFEGFVGGRLVFDGSLKGIPLPVDALKSALQR
ncbi:3-hydroxyacyl-ACP dehydratase FabZ family protein [Planctomycetota bacterium]